METSPAIARVIGRFNFPGHLCPIAAVARGQYLASIVERTFAEGLVDWHTLRIRRSFLHIIAFMAAISTLSIKHSLRSRSVVARRGHHVADLTCLVEWQSSRFHNRPLWQTITVTSMASNSTRARTTRIKQFPRSCSEFNISVNKLPH
jgi:hypothetical protein